MGNKISKKERERQQAAAKQKEKRSNQIYFIGMAIVMCIVAYGFGYLFNGMAVKTFPAENEVAQVTITDTRYSDEAVILSDEKEIEAACTLTGLLRVKMGEAELNEEPAITLVYQMNDGTEKQLLLGETVMRWDNQDYILKERAYNMFKDLVPAYFYPEQVTEE